MKIDRLLSFLEEFSQRGERWGDIPLTCQLDAVNILYNDNKRFYDSKTSGSTQNGKCDILIEDVYAQYEFLINRINPFYDKKEA